MQLSPRAAPRRRARPSLAAHVAVLVPAALALVLAVLGCTGLDSPGLWDLAWTLGASSALAGTVLARRTVAREARGLWTIWMLAAAAWLVGQFVWNLFDLTGHPASPNFPDICWWLFAALAMFSMIRAPSHLRGVRLVVAAESIPVMAAALALSFSLIWTDIAGSSLPTAAKISALVYRALYAAVIVVTLQTIISGQLRKIRSPGVLLAVGGILAESVAFMVWSSSLLEQSNLAAQTLLDSTWVVGLCAIGGGGLLAARRPERSETLFEPTYRGGLLPGASSCSRSAPSPPPAARPRSARRSCWRRASCAPAAR